MPHFGPPHCDSSKKRVLYAAKPQTRSFSTQSSSVGCLSNQKLVHHLFLRHKASTTLNSYRERYLSYNLRALLLLTNICTPYDLTMHTSFLQYNTFYVELANVFFSTPQVRTSYREHEYLFLPLRLPRNQYLTNSKHNHPSNT